MSSPKPKTVQRASGTPRHLVGGDPTRKAASDDGMSRADKANFIKAMMEGVKEKTPKAKAGAKAAKPSAKSVKSAGSKTAPAKSPQKPTPAKTVEILRKIPAPVKFTRPSNALSDSALALAKTIEASVASGDQEALTPEAVQALVTAVAKFYSANIDSGVKYPVIAHRMAISGTDAMILCGALLKGVDLQVFELGMWQSWSGL